MPTLPMSLDEFQDIIDRFGESAGDWPADRRTAAQALLAQSADARDRLAQAQALRHQFQDGAVTAPAGLADRILAKALGKAEEK